MFDFSDNPGLMKLYELMAAGSPPMFVRLLVLNFVFIVIAAVRHIFGAPRMRKATVIFVQVSVVGANMAVLLQEPLTRLVSIALRNMSNVF